MSHRYLKIKVCELGEEVRIIKRNMQATKRKYKKLEAKQKFAAAEKEKAIFWGYHFHKVFGSNQYLENRSSQLAYAYLRGKKYRQVEQKTNPLYFIDDNKRIYLNYPFNVMESRIVRMVNDFGPNAVSLNDIRRWLVAE